MLIQKDVVSWNALMGGYMQYDLAEDVLGCYTDMPLDGVIPKAVSFVYALKSCGMLMAIDKGFTVHLDILKKGLDLDLLVQNSLLDMYAKSGLFLEARHVFEELPVRTAVSWNILIGGLCENGQDKEAIKCCRQMQDEGIVADAITLACALRSCISTKDFVEGQAIFSNLIKKGFLGHDTYIGSSLVDLYMSGGMVLEADLVFKKLLIKDEFTWAALIRGYVENDQIGSAFGSFDCMKQNGVSCDSGVYVCVLRAVGRDRVIERGQKLHDEIIQKGFEMDSFTANNLADMYGTCGFLDKAKEVFDIFLMKNVVTWNARVEGFPNQGCHEEVLVLNEQMPKQHIFLNSTTCLCVLKACINIKSVEAGFTVHLDILKKGLDLDLLVQNSLLDMYAKSGLLLEARHVFEELPLRTAVNWNILIGGLCENGQDKEPIKCCRQMQAEGIVADAITLACALRSCISTKDFVEGQAIFSNLIKKGFLGHDTYIGSSLVDLYMSGGMVLEVDLVFKKLLIKDEFTWAALIRGYVENDEIGSAFGSFDCMKQNSVSCDSGVYVCVLRAVGRDRVIERGQKLHDEIIQKGFEMDSFTANNLADMYGTCGFLDKAKEVFDIFLMKNVVTWNARVEGFPSMKEMKKL
ncbi:hypothetical protein KP509_34G022800 [Ceratopteris richardii]|uniref:Pentatricopeptide repeat-containing protein n=1 Tax=Ceratopteris richardii TaxID=49495 RepID=A0A8T2QJJ5_CERRI|nr:hypothetical protein KP509_34G022800 [Ceratopteris richardii]